MVAGIPWNVEHKPVWAELGSQLARGVAGVVLVTLQAVLNLVRSQLEFIGNINFQ